MLIVHLNGDNHIQNFNLGGISSDIHSEATFYGSSYASLQNLISDHISEIPPQMKILNTVIP